MWTDPLRNDCRELQDRPEMIAARIRGEFCPAIPINGVAESFVNRLRDECVDVEWFNSRLEAKVFIGAWRQEYNHDRPHSSIGYKTSAQQRQDWLKTFGPKWGIEYDHQPRRLSA